MAWNSDDELPKDEPRAHFSVTPDKLEEISLDFLLAADAIIVHSQDQAELNAPSQSYSPAIILLAFALKAEMKALFLYVQEAGGVDNDVGNIDLDKWSLIDLWMLIEPVILEMHEHSGSKILGRVANVIERLQERIESIGSVEYSIHHGSELSASSAKDGFVSLIEMQGAAKEIHTFIAGCLLIFRD